MPKLVKPLSAKEVETAIQHARRSKTQKWLSDGNGLVLKLEASGSAKYWLRYRHPLTHVQQYRKLGEHSTSFGLADARKAAALEREILRQDKDPNEAAAERVLAEEATKQSLLAEIAATKARITVKELFSRWASTDLIRRKDGGNEVRRMFEKDVLPLIGDLAAQDISKGHITSVTDALLARGVRRMGKQIFSLMRQMFRFAESRDIVEVDPTAKIRKINIGGKDVERDRVLSEAEVCELTNKLPDARLIPSTEIALWLTLATCCRIGEILHAEWAHVNLKTGEWIIPAENAKNGKAHLIYLSQFALKHFLALHELNGTTVQDDGKRKNARWCFSNRDNDGPVSDKTVTKQTGDRQRGDRDALSRRSSYTNALTLSRGRWTPHDLRRTGATMMTALGVIPEVAERCLNHVEQNKIKRVYQRHNYEKEMREAWRLLGERLELLTTAQNSVDTPNVPGNMA
jgi:integrase